MIYVLFHNVDRSLVRVALTAEELYPVPVNSTLLELEEWGDVPASPYRWTPEIMNFAPHGYTDLLTQQEFMDEWELAGLGPVLDMLFSLEVQDSPQGTMARKWLTRFRTARGISKVDPRTIAGVDQLLAAAVLAGVITQSQANAGRPTILG